MRKGDVRPQDHVPDLHGHAVLFHLLRAGHALWALDTFQVRFVAWDQDEHGLNVHLLKHAHTVTCRNRCLKYMLKHHRYYCPLCRSAVVDLRRCDYTYKYEMCALMTIRFNSHNIVHTQ